MGQRILQFLLSFQVIIWNWESIHTLPSSTVVRATFPLTLWISLGCGLCTNVFHFMIYTSHNPICGTLSRTKEKKKGNLNIVSFILFTNNFNCLRQWKQYLPQSKMLITRVFWSWVQNLCFIMILSNLQTFFTMPSCTVFLQKYGQL